MTEEYIDMNMNDPNVLGKFQGFSRSFYVYSTALIILMDILMILLLIAKKIPRNGLKVSHMILFSLATYDLLYEAATTILFLHSSTCENVNYFKILRFVYLSLNLCTVFHILLEVLSKALGYTLGSGAFCSLCVWLGAFSMAFIDIENNNGLIDVTSMMWLDRFKALGYVLFELMVVSGLLVILMAACWKRESQKALFEMIDNEAAQNEDRHIRKLNLSVAPKDDILVWSICITFFVGWYAWVVIAVDSRMMMVIEVMKTFELIRLGCRILNPLTILCSFSWKMTKNTKTSSFTSWEKI